MSTLTREQAEALAKYARDISNAAIRVRPLGGSEMFTCVNGEYYADPKFVGAEIARIKDELQSAKIAEIRAKRLADAMAITRTPFTEDRS